MVTKKTSALKQALEGKQSKHSQTPAVAPVPAPAVNGTASAADRNYRGVMVSGYFDASVQKQLRIMSAETDKTVRDLIGEGLDLLFAKYGKPAIALTPVSEPKAVA
jgi:hypothetical protein